MRPSRRVSYGSNRGAKNPIITISTEFPNNPKNKDIFIDQHSHHQFFYDYDNSLWIPFGGSISYWVAGENLYQGESVYCSQSDGLLYKTIVSGDMAIGFVYRDCLSSEYCYFVRSGICLVLPETALSLSQGYIMYSSSSEAGRVTNAATVPAAATHFKEQGHVLENSSSAGALTKAIVHHN